MDNKNEDFSNKADLNKGGIFTSQPDNAPEQGDTVWQQDTEAGRNPESSTESGTAPTEPNPNQAPETGSESETIPTTPDPDQAPDYRNENIPQNPDMPPSYGNEGMPQNPDMPPSYGNEGMPRNPGMPPNYGYGGQEFHTDRNPGCDYGMQGYPYGGGCYQYPEQGGYEREMEVPVSVGEWLISMLLMLIPCVNIILMLVWAFSDREKKSKSNYFKARLIYSGVLIGIFFLCSFIYGIMLLAL